MLTSAIKCSFFLVIFALMGGDCDSQYLFSLQSPIGPISLNVNGKHYDLDSKRIQIPTHYPGLDTVAFAGDVPDAQAPFLCNFKPDTVYSISVACCGSLDIIPASKLRNDSLSLWMTEDDVSKVQHLLMDRPFISIRTLDPPRDSIYAWHADAACETSSRRINTELWQLGVPSKCFYWTNITTVLFLKTDATLAPHEPTDLEEFLSMENIVPLTEISFRLFDDQRFVIVYDQKRNRAVLAYE